MTGRLRKSVTIGACLVFIVMDRRADFYTFYVILVRIPFPLLFLPSDPSLRVRSAPRVLSSQMCGSTRSPSCPRTRRLRRLLLMTRSTLLRTSCLKLSEISPCRTLSGCRVNLQKPQNLHSNINRYSNEILMHMLCGSVWNLP
jgi:hypothetical protein